jgi:hypothetical protein
MEDYVVDLEKEIPHNANDPNVLSETNKNNPKKMVMENVKVNGRWINRWIEVDE